MTGERTMFCLKKNIVYFVENCHTPNTSLFSCYFFFLHSLFSFFHNTPPFLFPACFHSVSLWVTVTGCQSTSLPCVYIGQQSSTRLVALQECNSQGPCPPPPSHINPPHRYAFSPSFFNSLIAQTHSFPFSSLSCYYIFRDFPFTPLVPLIILPSAILPPTNELPSATFLSPFLPHAFSPQNLHSPSPSPFSIPFLQFREHCPSSLTPPIPLSSSPHLPLFPISLSSLPHSSAV